MTNRRWLKSAIATSAQPQVCLPFQRGQRSKPAAFKTATPVQAAVQTPPRAPLHNPAQTLRIATAAH
jgi:hypothetical protein